MNFHKQVMRKKTEKVRRIGLILRALIFRTNDFERQTLNQKYENDKITV